FIREVPAWSRKEAHSGIGKPWTHRLLRQSIDIACDRNRNRNRRVSFRHLRRIDGFDNDVIIERFHLFYRRDGFIRRSAQSQISKYIQKALFRTIKYLIDLDKSRCGVCIVADYLK